MSDTTITGPVVHQIQADMLGKRATQAIHMKQLDNRLRYLEVQLLADEESYPVPEGASVRLRGLKPDGKGAYTDAIGVAGDTVTFEISSNFLAASGKMPCEVEITLGESVVKSRTFVVEIDKEALPSEAVISTDEYTALLAAAHAAAASAANAGAMAINAAASADAAVVAASQAKAAQTAAQTARTAAETAQGKAETAQSNAEAAQTASQAARTASETAQGKAETAQSKAEAAAASAAEYAGLSKGAWYGVEFSGSTSAGTRTGAAAEFVFKIGRASCRERV